MSTINSEKEEKKSLFTHYLAIFVVCFFTFFINNQVIPADLMESRNLATAQEMVREGNYLVPTMNGELRLEKPPLPTWIAAGIENIIPGNLVIQRCMAGLSATLMVIFLYLFVSRVTRNRNIGLLSSLILATCFNIVLMGRTATWDIYCHSFMLGAIYFLFKAFEGSGAQWKNFILAGVFLGLSFLGKGPVSFYAMFLPFLISYIAVYRPKMKGKVAPLVAMILLCLIVSLWWMAYIYFFHQDMATAVAQKESSSWLNHNVRPWYYYWQFPAEAGIWALFLVTAIVSFFVYKKQEYRKEYKFALVWFIASLVLLSVIPEKKTRYLLPILIPGAIVTGFYFYHSIKNMATKGEKVIFRINGAIIALILVALPVVLYIMFYKENQISAVVLATATIFSWGLSAYIVFSLFGRSGIRPAKVFVGIIASMILVCAVCMIPIGQMFINADRHSIRMIRENKDVENLPFFYNDSEELRMELVYEADKTIKPMNLSDDSEIMNNLPFVLVSGVSIDSIFANKNVEIKKIDTFDNNWRKSGHKRYNWSLVREVAIIKAK
ncbi:glycosyltransferase family 39 protein [Dysgonomonas sp. 520]|uniref:ArnT family glycosyltransferase n=1 Tax=Dysgonomonas sp. 520 TaxID=2302931 RepID=UPI0013D12A77|nr:glycosyltransferase family 39 protein [Dysgonomonas sp. 520]NDW08343.1 glycosyltransferase family 39 protein [Dysgonomonas sp. 520]